MWLLPESHKMECSRLRRIRNLLLKFQMFNCVVKMNNVKLRVTLHSRFSRAYIASWSMVPVHLITTFAYKIKILFMNGFGCCGHRLLTFSLRVNWNLSPGSESFWFTRHFSEMNGLPLLTRWEQQGSGVRCYSVCVYTYCVHVRMCLCVLVCALVTASKAMAMDHEVFTLCLLFNLSYHHRLTPQSSHST